MTARPVRVLPEELAAKIAAGEVVQRPESVVKELVENALDAGASAITVVLKEGGRRLIQVSDDGSGMGEQDAATAFLRHATSKIATYEDLEAIGTFGFRGEALASIAAVAQVTMLTRQPEDELAVQVRVEGGGPPVLSKDARPQGTTITVQNLFFNVPARRKFLKSPATEFRHVHDVLLRTAISHPGLRFDFVSDDDNVLQLAAGSFEQRLTDVFGERQLEGLLRVEEQTELLHVWGYISKPTFGQRSRSNQFVFLNHRSIVNRTVNHAVVSSYEHLLSPGVFPFFVLFLDVDPHRVDVNIHPSKMEVKFDDEQGIHRIIASMVRKALAGSMAVPSLSARDGRAPFDIGLAFTGRQHHLPPEPMNVDLRTGEIIPLFSSQGTLTAGAQDSPIPFPRADGPMRAETSEHAEGGAYEATGLIWQLHNRYILCQIKSGLMIVDQHVAHERVLYERALDKFGNALRSSQQLLFPSTQTLQAGDYTLMEELSGEFSTLGFDCSLLGKGTVVVNGVPPDVRPGNEGHIIEEMLTLYKEYSRDSPTAVRDNLAKSFSCKSAIKSGDALTEQEMRSLVDQLFATRMPYVCPHGRPILLRISLDELDRRFGRR